MSTNPLQIFARAQGAKHQKLSKKIELIESSFAVERAKTTELQENIKTLNASVSLMKIEIKKLKDLLSTTAKSSNKPKKKKRTAVVDVDVEKKE